ncbi:MAG: hypothetical protein EU533_04895 [Promethearchaeota archaeon]|nr:MAG: hypothetical protein EU533_04895 [Candidatus Lokiarchaeota archaeon]
MSLHKWFDDEETKQRRKKRDDLYNSLPKEKVQDLKKKGIRNVMKDTNAKKDPIYVSNKKSSEFIQDIIEFKEWLDSRTYLKGDLNRIETWIRILYKKLESVSKELKIENEKEELIEEFRKIPPDFLEEKTRIALNKKLRGNKRDSSDYYYLRKLKVDVENILIQAKYYETLKKILDL